MSLCKCGCGQQVRSSRVFVNKEHQLAWMHDGGAKQLNALQPIEAKVRGGHTAGTDAALSGRLMEAAQKGGAVSHEIAERFKGKAKP